MSSYIGIEIGGTKLQLFAGTETGEILERTKLSVAREQGAEGIRRQIEKTLPVLAAKYKASGVGVGFGGPVDWQQGRICKSHHIEGWSEFPMRGWLMETGGLPAEIDNDANVAALGEARHGAGRGHNPVFYVTMGSGVGGGLVCNGEIYHGAIPGEAEIGHVRLDKSGATVESRCSGWAVDGRIRTVAKANAGSTLAKLIGSETAGEARFLKAAIDQGDALAKKIIEEIADDLAFGLSHAVHLFHPGMIVLGGGLSGVGEPLRAAVKNRLPGYLMKAFGQGPEIVLSVLKEDAVPIGAICLAAERKRVESAWGA